MNAIVGRGRVVGLNDLAINVGSIGGALQSGSTEQNPDTGGVTSSSNKKVGDNCPCRYQTRRNTKYLVDKPQPGATPVIVEETGIICDTPDTTTTKILCDETNQALAGGQLNDGVACRGINLSGLANSTELPISGNITYGSQQPKEGMAGLPWLWIGGALAAGALGTVLIMKK